MAVTNASVIIVAPEFANEDTARIDKFIQYAMLYIKSEVFGERYDFAIELMTAHLLTMSNRRGQAGAVTQKRVGDMSVSYAGGDSSDEALASTSYGNEYLRLRRINLVTPMVT